MLGLSPHVTFHARGQAVFAWHGRTGDVAEMSRDVLALLLAYRQRADPDRVAARRPGGLSRADARRYTHLLAGRLFLVPDGGREEAALRQLYPVVSPLFVAYPRVDGGLDAYDRDGEAHPLSPETDALLARCDGTRTLAELLDAASARPLWPLATARFAALKLLPAPRFGPLPGSVRSTMPWPELADPDRFAREGPTGPRPDELSRYHLEAIASADRQFEEVETTLSHLFRHPHPALQGRTFGAALADALRERGVSPRVDGPPRTLEIGGGLGYFGAAMRDALGLSRWTTVDLSPALARSQRARGLAPVCADARALPFRDRSLDLVLSNEMAGDLGTEGGVNVGALGLVREIARVLRPGGLAYVSEFGTPDGPPVRSDHLDHDEWSLRFNDLAACAREQGLEAELVPVPALLGLDGRAPALATTRASFAALRGLFRDHGLVLDKRAWTLAQLEQLCEGRLDLARVRGLDVRPLGERTMGLVPGEFWALLARRRP